ncbi:MAG TPA: DUF368 domain-containing protein [Fervidobacterium sp.]|nr:DUF368 domain-containing protein [Fervidobacterium sp.]HOK87720.1 DUF368 domain-containing protein [Fervidobacterium sp.]HOM74059.1 DUF368 domain-containing protein [Fervidobacterium sp.]HPP17683.1 DUF368 domain-containing protein [Fervidobacterium sp.]HRD19854.1 DUF368 domain-containing protein [Fervidobacterium sp.]
MYEIYIRPLIAGLLMGLANIIPGISGGTIAVITGIFEKLVDALNGLSKLKLKRIELIFLIILAVGELSGLAIGSNILIWAFKNYPFYTYSFFFGLILFSIYALKDEIKGFRIVEFLVGVLLVVIPYLISKPSSIGTTDTSHVNYILLFISGIVSGASMILPGISGSLMLMLLGFYDGTIQAVGRITKQLVLSDVVYLLILGVGTLVGIFLITKLIKIWFARARESIMNFILGLVAGSLYPITPSLHGSGNTGFMLVWFAIGALLIMVINLRGTRAKA